MWKSPKSQSPYTWKSRKQTSNASNKMRAPRQIARQASQPYNGLQDLSRSRMPNPEKLLLSTNLARLEFRKRYRSCLAAQQARLDHRAGAKASASAKALKIFSSAICHHGSPCVVGFWSMTATPTSKKTSPPCTRDRTFGSTCLLMPDVRFPPRR